MELQLRALVKKSLQENFQPIRIELFIQKLFLKMQKSKSWNFSQIIHHPRSSKVLTNMICSIL